MMLKLCSIMLPVALLFCCTGCVSKKVSKGIQKNSSPSTGVYDQRTSRASLIMATAQKVVREGQKSEGGDQKAVLSSKKKSRKKTHVTQRLAQVEARLGEVPVPLMARAIDATENGKGGYQIVYETQLSRKDLSMFYCQEMLRLGWGLVTMIEAEESFYSFRKNGQMCTVLVRPVGGWWRTKRHQLHLYVQV